MFVWFARPSHSIRSALFLPPTPYVTAYWAVPLPKALKNFFGMLFAPREGMPIDTDLYPQICSFENLYQAYRKARKGKRGKESVARFEYNQEEELLNTPFA